MTEPVISPHSGLGMYWDAGHPYRVRTWLRSRVPWFLVRLLPNGHDCTAAGGSHWWYNIDGERSGCYHCRVVADGELWRHADSTSE
jgi:hypothetical protein